MSFLVSPLPLPRVYLLFPPFAIFFRPLHLSIPPLPPLVWGWGCVSLTTIPLVCSFRPNPRT